jgi:hypothetical protein
VASLQSICRLAEELLAGEISWRVSSVLVDTCETRGDPGQDFQGLADPSETDPLIMVLREGFPRRGSTRDFVGYSG